MLTEGSNFEDGDHRPELEVCDWEIGLEVWSGDDTRHDSGEVLEVACVRNGTVAKTHP